MPHFTPRGVIEPIGNLAFRTNYSQVGKGHEGILFSVRTPDYVLEVGFTSESFYILRNSNHLEFPLIFVNLPNGDVDFFATWSVDELRLVVLDESFREFSQSEVESEKIGAVNDRTLVLKTPPTVPPFSLISWARDQLILPTTSDDSRSSFYQTVVFLLEHIQDSVTNLGSINPFWDITYEGSRIVSRLPKRETDIQPTIRLLLYNQWC